MNYFSLNIFIWNTLFSSHFQLLFASCSNHPLCMCAFVLCYTADYPVWRCYSGCCPFPFRSFSFSHFICVKLLWVNYHVETWETSNMARWKILHLMSYFLLFLLTKLDAVSYFIHWVVSIFCYYYSTAIFCLFSVWCYA